LSINTKSCHISSLNGNKPRLIKQSVLHYLMETIHY